MLFQPLPNRLEQYPVENPRMLSSADEIVGILREQEAGAKFADPARKYAGSEATLYNWKAEYGGVDISEAKRLKALAERERLPL